MKTLKWLMIVPAFFLLLCTSCASEEEAMDTIQETNLSYSKYSEYSEKPLVSILDLAQGKASISRSGDYILGLTEEDANYFNSLDSDGLLNLKTELMNKWGFESDEDIENVLDQVYDELC
jgi:ABC-type amino acid transport substrate-binding protein